MKTSPKNTKLKIIALPKTFALGAAAALLFCVGSTQAAFHLWDVGEVYSSADGSVQYIKIVALAGGQEFLGTFGATITAANGNGQSTFTFPADLPGDTANKVCILGTTNLSTIPGGLVPDYIIPPNFIRPPVGGGSASITFNPSGLSIPYSALPTDGDLALTKSGGVVTVATNAPKNFNGDANTIVPVKFLSATSSGTNFLMDFRTATGVNGSAGPLYTVQYTTGLSISNWTTLGTFNGDGTPKTASDSLKSAPQKCYRLSVP